MRNWRNWLAPVLTCLTVLELALLPQRLSAIQDRQLTETVHTEELPADSNFPARPPELPGRIWLLAQYFSGTETLTIVDQQLEEPGELEEVRSGIQAELEVLGDLDILPTPDLIREELGISLEEAAERFPELGGRKVYLRDRTDLSSAGFLMVNIYHQGTGEVLSLYLDRETGRALALELVSPLLWKNPLTAETAGRAFLDGLGTEHELLYSYGGFASFRLPGSKTIYEVQRTGIGLTIVPQVNWEAVDEEITDGQSSAVLDCGITDAE